MIKPWKHQKVLVVKVFLKTNPWKCDFYTVLQIHEEKVERKRALIYLILHLLSFYYKLVLFFPHFATALFQISETFLTPNYSTQIFLWALKSTKGQACCLLIHTEGVSWFSIDRNTATPPSVEDQVWSKEIWSRYSSSAGEWKSMFKILESWFNL